MKILAIDTLHCDAGWRNFSYVKITTDEDIVGYSEYNESYGSKGVSGVIEKLVPVLVGRDALANEVVFAHLYAMTRQAP
ncbi:MAG TPA: mandelate racemase/muconate lactonizing enzyme family protein, partial [Gammaproteobacteria bacterium]|nr:mandelate racemase/muconate lactonizing enzyme family protein [Gammaproteobacteria bacterium]